MFTQLQYAGNGWFVRKTFRGVNCIQERAFRRDAHAARKMGYTNAQLDRVETPEPCLHVVSHYAHLCAAEMRAGNKRMEEWYTQMVLMHTDACLGQITKLIEE